MDGRNLEEISADLGEHSPETIGAAALVLTEDEKVTLRRAVFPLREQLQTYIDDVSDPSSPNYDEDLAVQ
ncbi:MAG TPA: hypothetical protein VLE69_03315 [Candidatus Saccharimonadales bacterium]|nr:hypothetical protein [Candidatus Saccharimonadales bacterium]